MKIDERLRRKKIKKDGVVMKVIKQEKDDGIHQLERIIEKLEESGYKSDKTFKSTKRKERFTGVKRKLVKFLKHPGMKLNIVIYIISAIIGYHIMVSASEFHFLGNLGGALFTGFMGVMIVRSKLDQH